MPGICSVFKKGRKSCWMSAYEYREQASSFKLSNTVAAVMSCNDTDAFLRDFMGYIQRYKSFFITLPEMLCEGELVVDDYTCWSGEDVVER